MQKMVKTLIFVLFLIISIGFAAVTTSLVLNNSSSIRSNPDDFEVIFSNTSAINGTSSILSDKQTIIYETNQLMDVNDYSVLNYTVTNNSSQYDANINIRVLDADDNIINSEYYIIEHTSPLPSVISARTSADASLTIRLIKQSINNFNNTFKVLIDVNAVERNITGIGDKYYGSKQILLNPNGGTISNNQISVDIGKTVGELPIPSFTNKKFDGWYTDAEGGNRITSDTVVDTNMVDTFYAHWIDIQALIPVMTSNTSEVCTVSSNSVLNSSYQTYYAFDNNPSTCWAQASWTISGGYLSVDFKEPKVAKKLELVMATKYLGQYTSYNLRNFEFQASNNGTDWDVLLKTINTDSTPSITLSYDLDNDNEYLFYRLYTIDVNDTTNHYSNDRIQLGEMQIYGY